MIMMKNRVKRNTAAAILGAAMAICLGTVGCRSIITPLFPIPENREMAWRQDIGYLRKAFPVHNMSFDDDELEEFQRILDGLEDSIPTASDNKMIVGIMKSVATAGDVHTKVSLQPSAQKFRRVPIRFYWFSDGLYVVKATERYADVLGFRIVELGGFPPELLVEQLRDILPGNPSSVRYLSGYYLSSPDFLEGMGVIENPDSVKVTFEAPDGSTFALTLPTMPMSPPVTGYQLWRELSPLSTVGMDAGDMLHVLGNTDLPAYLSRPNESCSLEYFAEARTLYIQINQNTNLNCDLLQFSKEVEEAFSTNPVDDVIVDLRFNSGGDLTLTSELVTGIPEWHQSSGNIFIVTGGPTFSAGIVTAARLKYYAGDRAIVIGEPAAEGLKFWAETRFITLPNSKLRIYAGYAAHNWEDGVYETGTRYFWLMQSLGVPAGDIDVDIPVAVLYQDYLQGKDPVLSAIMAM